MALLLANGADINAVSISGQTAVHYATTAGFDEALALLLNHGFDVNYSHNGCPSPLICAAMSAKPGCLDMLLDSQAVDVDFTDKFGENALLEAAGRGFTVHADLLLQHGADVNFRSKGDFNQRWTSLMKAAWRGSPLTVEVLIKHNADVTMTDSQGRTALSLAAEGGQLQVVMKLCQAGCPTNLADNTGKTPLIYACTKGHEKTARCLLFAGAGPNITDNTGRSAYSYSSERLDLKRILYIAGADGNDLSDKMWAHLLSVANFEDANAVKQKIAELLADPEALNNDLNLAQICRVAVKKHLSQS